MDSTLKSTSFLYFEEFFLPLDSSNSASFWSFKWRFEDLLKYLYKAAIMISILTTISRSDRHCTARLLRCVIQCMSCMSGTWKTCSLLVTPVLFYCKIGAPSAPNTMNRSLIWCGVNPPSLVSALRFIFFMSSTSPPSITRCKHNNIGTLSHSWCVNMYLNPRLVVQRCHFIASDREVRGCTYYFFCPCLHKVK